MSVYNGERFLREAIESILSQTFRDFEFIIVNDGSTDGTAAILDSYATSDPRVRVCHQENRGAAASWNRGCSSAQGKYIARMDADDIAIKDRLSRQIEFLENHHEVGVLGSAVEFIDNTGKTLWNCPYPEEDHDIRSALLHWCPFAHPAVVMRRETFSSVGGYRNAFADAADYDLWTRIADRYQLANLAEVLVKYRIHPAQVSCSKMRQQCFAILAIQTLASARMAGKPEPVISGESITPELLERLGVDQATQHRTLVAGYGYWIGVSSRASQDDTFLRLVDEFIELSKSGPIEKDFPFRENAFVRAYSLSTSKTRAGSGLPGAGGRN